MKKILVIVLLLLLAVLQYQLWFTDNGLLKTMKLQKLVRSKQQLNAELKAKNDTLTNEINNLREGTGTAENAARHDLGMIKKGETFYRIINTKP